MGGTVERTDNKISLQGKMNEADIFPFSRTLYNACERASYPEIVLDFSACEALFQNFMVPLIADVSRYQNVDFDIVLPTSRQLEVLFHNANWAHLIAPRYHEHSTFSSNRHLPAMSFSDSESHAQVVDKIMNILLSSSLDVNRKSLAALEWSVNEITDNVLNHSQSVRGGVVQATTHFNNVVEFVVADSGIGIARSLGEKNEAVALEKAIQEGVTRNSDTNQGNGLFGSYQVATLSGGYFELISGYKQLVSTNNKLKINSKNSPFNGTIVISRIDCTKQDVLASALKFKGKIHSPPYDYIEKHFENPEGEEFIFIVKNESQSLGSRDAGKTIYNKLSKLIKASENQKISIDFSDTYVISSSFADEVFGRIFVDMGPMDFMSRLQFINTDVVVKGLIDRAIKQRYASSVRY